MVVQAVLIPRQEGTSDTCTMKEEERVVGVQLERGLIALGWVSEGYGPYARGGPRLILRVMATDTHAPNAIMLHVVDGFAYAFGLSTDFA